MFTGKVKIIETSRADLENVMNLWNDGTVMYYVGFPDGIKITLDKLYKWLEWVIQKPKRCHYSIYADGIGYCGETFYNIDEEHDLAFMDIKLLPIAQGKGIAKIALSYALDKAFNEGHAKYACVDPHPDNKAAWSLYDRLGFRIKSRPKYLDEGPTYLEITMEEWSQRP
ncbi:MAG: GNAT family N-acetyltransferase [Candidatus Izemoplasmatales bacterium]|jgi:RimJ/RimL family protein N-acetyltransferase|nr:GNAT family N-acetyltransferase [Candidatus Izemoplasmatales bacterium]